MDGTLQVEKEEQLGLTVTGKLPLCVLSLVEDGVKRAAVKWGVPLPKGMKFSYQNDPHRLGNRPLAPCTKATYEEHYKQMFQYCCIKGDYESLLILLLPGSTEGVPSFEVNTAKQFVQVKRTQKIQS